MNIEECLAPQEILDNLVKDRFEEGVLTKVLLEQELHNALVDADETRLNRAREVIASAEKQGLIEADQEIVIAR